MAGARFSRDGRHARRERSKCRAGRRAFRVGDGPVNSITPLNPYLALIVGLAQKYDRGAGVGTVVALMLPYVAWMFAIWTLLFVAWYLLGLPWGV